MPGCFLAKTFLSGNPTENIIICNFPTTTDEMECNKCSFWKHVSCWSLDYHWRILIRVNGMWRSWPERQSATNSSGRKSIGKPRLIYNIDRNVKSSCVPEPELINGAAGEKRAKTISLTSWNACRNKDQGKPRQSRKLSKESASRTRKDSWGW